MLEDVPVGIYCKLQFMVLFMIIINDKPFYGSISISSDPYKLILERVIDVSK